MATPMTTAIPEGLDLSKDYVIEFTALDAATGADVAAVVVSDVSLLVESSARDDRDNLVALPPVLEFQAGEGE